MARRNKRGRAAAAAVNDFTIHEDQPTRLDDSDIRDFAAVATDSNLTKASTLVNEDVSSENGDKSVEARLDSMLEELQEDKKNNSAPSSRRESTVSRRDSFDSLKKGRYSLHETDYTDDNVSRRASGASCDATEDSYSRRDSNGTYSSRRESGYSETQDQSALDDGSVLGDHSTISDHSSSSLHRRASGRTEALIHAAARNIVDQINRTDDDRSDYTESYISHSRTSSPRHSGHALYVPGAKDMGVRPSDALCYVSNGSRKCSPVPPSETGDRDHGAIPASPRVSNAHSLVGEDLADKPESVFDDEPSAEPVLEVHDELENDLEDSWAALVEDPADKAARQEAQEAEEAETHVVESVPSPVVAPVDVTADLAVEETGLPAAAEVSASIRGDDQGESAATPQEAVPDDGKSVRELIEKHTPEPTQNVLESQAQAQIPIDEPAAETAEHEKLVPEDVEQPDVDSNAEEVVESTHTVSNEGESEPVTHITPEAGEEHIEEAAEVTSVPVNECSSLTTEEPTALTTEEAADTVPVSTEPTSEASAANPDEQHDPAAVMEDDSFRNDETVRVPEIELPADAKGASEVDMANQTFADHCENDEDSFADRTQSQCGDSVMQSIEHDHEPSPEENADSSHNEHEDDVFSEHSPRSSVGSTSGEDHHQHPKMSPNVTHRTRTPRVSDFSHYETDDQEEIFIPTVRGTPRPPFRSPSSVKAMQMSSPAQSVIGSGRSSRRTPIPSGSRLGSPSAQYSPKKTPPRFRRATPPLVLLHVTLLPLRWGWGDVLEQASSEQLSEGGKRLRQAWRQLQDRMGDTTCERGILLPHPQNDFEILEERLLEALELPLRRRARILECGHYLGPANETTILEESSEDEDDQFVYEESHRESRSSMEKKHWCSTCHSEIRFDSLGAGRVFRVKVYASNGLIKAGAWEACWKEMERVDVEIEPIVESDVQEEMTRLDDEQQQALELHQEQLIGEDEEDNIPEEDHVEEELREYLEEPTEVHHEVPSSPVPEIRVMDSPAPPSVDEQQRQHEERLREIYGHSPQSVARPLSVVEHSPPPSDSVPRHGREQQQQHHHHHHREQHHQMPPSPSPSAEAYARHQERRQPASREDSLPELILEATKVMLRDSKNVAILLMSVLVLVLALRGGSSAAGFDSFPTMPKRDVRPVIMPQGAVNNGPATVTVTAAPPQDSPDTATTATVTVTHTAAAVAESIESRAADEVDAVSSQEIIKVYETVTETAFETSTVTTTQGVDIVETEVVEVSEIEEDGGVFAYASESFAPEGDFDQAFEPGTDEASLDINGEEE